MKKRQQIAEHVFGTVKRTRNGRYFFSPPPVIMQTGSMPVRKLRAQAQYPVVSAAGQFIFSDKIAAAAIKCLHIRICKHFIAAAAILSEKINCPAAETTGYWACARSLRTGIEPVCIITGGGEKKYLPFLVRFTVPKTCSAICCRFFKCPPNCAFNLI